MNGVGQDWTGGRVQNITKIVNNNTKKSKQAKKQTSQKGEDEERTRTRTRRIVQEPVRKQEEGKAMTRGRD